MSNQSSKSPEYTLGTLEFCAALNGDDPELVRVALQKFIRLVRKERRQAILVDESSLIQDEEEEDTRDDGEEDVKYDDDHTHLQQPPTKKPKLESWKLDSKAYNVPFVGTSIQKGSEGTVVKNEWPTGFVKAYLEVSPEAQELIHSMKHFVPSHEFFTTDSPSKRKYSQTLQLQILYIQAFGELLTCAMPKEQVLAIEYFSSISSWRRFIESSSPAAGEDILDVPEIQCPFAFVQGIRDHLPYLLKAINDITMARIEHRQVKEGKGSSNAHASSHIPTLSKEQVDVATAALTTITHLACTSVRAARDVARGLNTMIHESVFIALMRTHARPKTNKKKVPSEAETTQDKKKESSLIEKKTLSTHSACLDLASVLLETKDSVVFSFISNSGNKERKIGPGMIHHVLRWGLSSDKFQGDRIADDVYLIRVYRFFKSLREFLSCFNESMTSGVKSSSSSRHRSMLQLLKDDPLLRICEISLKTRSNEINKDMSTLECAAVEGRNLLFLLLIDVQSSPFLQVIHDTRSVDNPFYKSLAHQLTRCVHMLVTSTYDTSLRERIVEYLQNSPPLLPYFFRSFSLPEPSPSFTFFSRISFIRSLLEKGPVPSTWLGETLEDSQEQHDNCTLWIMPSRLSKNYLTKSIQSSNALIVSHMLKLITSILRRTAIFTREIDQDKRALLTDMIQKRLPDLQTFLAIRSRFDPFRATSQLSPENTSSVNCDSNYFVIFYLCCLLQQYRSLFEVSTQYDWTKLLPDSPESFRTSPIWFQTRLIQTLTSMYSTEESGSIGHDVAPSPKMLQVLVHLQHNSTHSLIHQDIQCALIKFLYILLRPSDGHRLTLEQNLCLRYECTLWAQSFTIDNVSFCCKQIELAQQSAVHHAVSTYLYWKRTFPTEEIPSLCFSPLLSISLTSMATNLQKYKPNDVEALRNLTVKLLHFQTYPLLLASFVVQALSEPTTCEPKSADEGAIAKIIINLRQYVINRYSIRCRREMCDILIREDGTDSRVAIQPEPLSDGCSSTYDRERMKAVSRVSLSDHNFVSFASLKFQVQNSKVMMRSKNKIGIREHFVSLRRVLIYILLANASDSERLIRILFSVLDNFQVTDYQSNVSMMILFSSNPHLSVDTVHGDAYIRKCHSVLELYSSHRSIQCNSDTAVFLSSLALSNFSPFHYLLNSTGSILSNLELELAGNGLPYFCRVALATVDFLLKNGKTNSDEWSRDFPLPFNLVIKLWIKLSMTKDDDFSRSVSCMLDVLIISTFTRGYTVASCNLLTAIRQSGLTETIQVAIDLEKYELLKALLKYDVFSFAHAVTQGIASNSRGGGDIVNRGLLAATMFCELQKHERGLTELLTSDEQRNVADLIYDAMFHLLKGCDVSSIGEKRSRDLLLAMNVLLLFKLIAPEKLQAFSDLIASIFEVAAKLSKKNLLEIEKQLIDFICKTISDRGGIEMNEIMMVTHVYHCALDRLYQTLPYAFRDSVTPESNAPHNEPPLLHQLHQLRTMMVAFCSIDAQCKNYQSKHIKGWLISCLKHGIHDEATSVSSYCLQLLRIVLKWTITSNIMSPSQLFFMAVSHSRFDKLLATSKSEAKEQLICLLIMCVSQDSTIKAERGVFSSLLSGYNAGPRRDDKLARLLLFLLCENYRLDQTSTLPVSICDFAWGELQLKKDTFDENILVAPDHGSEWEWLLEGLDNRRIQGTIHDFPTNEVLIPSSSLDTDETVNEESFLLQSSNRDIDADKEDRYDPAFLVPLILGALRSFFPGQLSESNNQREKFVLIAQRLCRKGVISLALACFAGSCHGLRQTSLGVLSLLLQAMQMKEAHSLVSWKERPQLEMILNSFQRGLLLIRLMDSSSNIDNGSHSPEDYPPQLPYVCTIFLAKAAWILSLPADDLYPAMNKFFLRLDSEHGAYKDVFSLPAFISLFCNSSDDITQAQKERVWALQLLKEGIADQVCLDVIIKKHIPELLLTTFDSLSTRSSINQAVECNLILETMRSIFDRGSSDKFPSLTNKLGLFPWILQMVNKLTSKRHKLLWKFFNFTNTCLASYARFVDPIPSEILSTCFMNIANAVLLSAIDNAEGKNESLATLKQIQDIAGGTLITVHSILEKTILGKNEESIELGDSCLTGGLCISSCVKFLNLCDSLDTPRLCQLAHCICSLPLDIRESDSIVLSDFIKSLLLQLSKVSSGPSAFSKSMPQDIIRRVRLIIENFPGNCCDKDLITLFLQVRLICRWNKTSWDDWLASLSKLLNCSNNEGDILTAVCLSQ